MKHKQTFLLIALSLSSISLKTQTIRLNFPYFAGKAYDFILFQGDKTLTVAKDTIPPDGKFELIIPKEYAPYTGMCRWLLTNTKEGGGLDIEVPGHDFSVECLAEHPDDKNIIYTKNRAPGMLDSLYRRQEEILTRYKAMQQALAVFSKTDEDYPVFEQQVKKQSRDYTIFHSMLQANLSYTAKFLYIVNLVRGVEFRLGETEPEKAKNLVRYAADTLDWKALFTSGHWTPVIDSWLTAHTQVLKDPYSFAEDFEKIGNRIPDAYIYSDFADRVAYFLTRQGRDDLIGLIAQTVVGSRKISKYDGPSKVYITGAVGTQAADLVITGTKGSGADMVLKSAGFVSAGYQKAMLLFYEAGCPGCERLLEGLLPKYDSLKAEGVRVIAISADPDEASFRSRSKNFPWKDTFCDYQGMSGVNFKNYGVVGTPTVFIIDKTGKIEKRTAGFEEFQK